MPARRDPRPRRHVWAGVLPAAAAVALTAGCSTATAPPAAQPSTAASAAASTSPQATGTAGRSGADGSADHQTPTAPATPQSVPESGSGRTTPVAVPGSDSPEGEGRVVRYTVEIEGGLEKVAVGFPEAVRSTLTDERGWETKDKVRFVNVTPEERKAGAATDIRIRFASGALVDKVCAPLRTNGHLSCHDDGDVMVNAWRWVNGSDTYGDDLANYRIYLVNHEVGHSIGHGHVPCPGKGEKAPIMLQQTLRLEGCKPYPYSVR